MHNFFRKHVSKSLGCYSLNLYTNWILSQIHTFTNYRHIQSDGHVNIHTCRHIDKQQTTVYIQSLDRDTYTFKIHFIYSSKLFNEKSKNNFRDHLDMLLKE